MKALILIAMFLLQLQPAQSPPNAGAIRGRVTFRDGSPVGRMNVMATSIIATGRPTVVRGFTDETGSYLIERVPAGNYYVGVALPSAAVIHPGVTAENAAIAVVVQQGATVPGIDIVIPDSLSGVRVSGRVIYAPGQSPPVGTQQARLSALQLGVQKASLIAADGTFEFSHVLPGPYSVAVPSPGAPPLRITVADRDLSGIEVAVPRLVVVNGTMTAEGGARPSITITFTNQNYETFATVQPNGTFTTQLPEGQFVTAVLDGRLPPTRFAPIGVPPFVSGYYVMTFGTDSLNLLTGPLKINASDSSVRVTLALGRSPGVKVSGRVPSAADARGPALSRKLTMTGTVTFETFETAVNPDGSFEIPKIMPGSYRASATLTPELYSAPVVVTIPNRDLAELEIAPLAPVEITGRIAVDGNGPPPRFSLTLDAGGSLPVKLDANGVPSVTREDVRYLAFTGGVHIIQVEVNALPDGSFRMTLPQGDYRVFPTVPSPDYFIRSMTHGQSRLLTEPLHVTDKESAELHVGFGATKVNPWRKVSGRVVGFDPGRGPFRVALEASVTSTIETPVNPDGTFQFFSVLSDTTYTARLLPQNDAVPTMSVAVADKDVEGLQINVPREREVTIRASVEGTAPVPAFLLTLTPARPTEAVARSFSAISVSALIKPEADGSSKARLPEDERRVQISGFPLGYTVKSLNYGSVDLLNTPVKLAGPDSSVITAVFATDPAVPFGNIQGRVTGLDPEVRDVRLVLNGAAAFATYEAPLSATGTFSFSKIPQGTYVPTLAGDVVSGLLSPPSIVVTGRDFSGIEINLPKGSKPNAVVEAPKTGATLSDLSNPSLLVGRNAANESAAVANLRTINTALVTFLAANRGNYGTIPDLISAGLLDSTFTGVKAGFLFSVIPVGRGYAAVALPGSPDMGRYGFYSTQDAVARYSPIPILSPPRRGGNPVQ